MNADTAVTFTSGHFLNSFCSAPPHPPAQLSPNRRVILWLALENENGARASNYFWRDIPICTVTSLVCMVLLERWSNIELSRMK